MRFPCELVRPLILVLVAIWAAEPVAQNTGVARLARDAFDVLPPTAHVRGTPGSIIVDPQACRILPTQQTRQRIVDVAVQEWAFFGFRVVDQTVISADRGEAPRLVSGQGAVGVGSESARRAGAPGRRGRRRPRLNPEEAARVASTVAGYWAVTPQGSWIVGRQNEEWNGRDAIAARWNAPWSAAFISWVMCEGGLGSAPQFQRAIAHHTYIDQAIRARDGSVPAAAFAAYDIGEAEIAPGDLLCSSRQPAYRTIAERRRQMGVGARSHCDIVVSIDEPRERLLAIGGNVRGTVSLKLNRAIREKGKPLRPAGAGDESRPFFAHLKLRAPAIDDNALAVTPTMAAFRCEVSRRTPVLLANEEPTDRRATAFRC